jgi:hypothetical protein
MRRKSPAFWFGPQMMVSPTGSSTAPAIAASVSPWLQRVGARRPAIRQRGEAGPA